MILEGTYEFRAARMKLWDFITDPAKIGSCLPDLKSLDVESEERFIAIIRVGVGFIKADFKFRIDMLEKEPISRVRLRAVGAGSGSSINLDVAIELREIPGGSQLVCKSDVKVGGMMASLGQRVIKDTADKTLASIFECFKKQVE
jgi:carbon monoxide dehydrogenase subunit G